VTPPRREMVELAHYLALHGARGGEVNRAVTEGRDVGKYSSCGDLVHCVLYAAGCRSGWINRGEHDGWRMGANLSRLWPLWHRSPLLGLLLPGDVILLDGDRQTAHVAIAVSLSTDRSVLTTADYGQPGGKVLTCQVRVGDRGEVTIRGRRWTHHGSLARVPWTAPALTVGQWLAAHGLDSGPWYERGLTADVLCTPEELDRMAREGTE